MAEKIYTLEAVGERVRGLLETLIRKGGFRLQFELSGEPGPHAGFEDADLRVEFTGPDTGLLLENRGELLLAFEYLTMEMLRMPPEHHSRIFFDAASYRTLRIQELRMSAAVAAEQVRSSGRPFEFQAMNSRERRIIHLALRDEAGVVSESDGEGPRRHVVIRPAGYKPPSPFRRRR